MNDDVKPEDRTYSYDDVRELVWLARSGATAPDTFGGEVNWPDENGNVIVGFYDLEYGRNYKGAKAYNVEALAALACDANGW